MKLNCKMDGMERIVPIYRYVVWLKNVSGLVVLVNRNGKAIIHFSGIFYHFIFARVEMAFTSLANLIIWQDHMNTQGPMIILRGHAAEHET